MEAAMTAAYPAGAMPPTKNRGKDQIPWSEDVWKRIDAAVTEEMMRTRVAAKFLPIVHVPKKVTTVPSDVVIVPKQGDADQSLSVDESQTDRVNEVWVEFRLTPAQVEDEASEEMAMSQGQRYSTGVTLGMRSGNSVALAEDTVILNGSNGVLNSPFLQSGFVQFRDPQLAQHLDPGLAGINADGSVALPAKQIILVPPATQGPPLRYAENTLDAVAQGFSVLQEFGHYEHYALVLNTVPYADLHTALATTLITAIEPISHIVKAGVYGTATLPPFDGNKAGLPKTLPQGISLDGANILFTGVLVSLAGNTMDLVRGRMDTDGSGKELDVATIYNQKDVNENYRFRVAERFALRLKDPSAVILLLFLDKQIGQ
jgi:uncharacterized linocin/CFP29 family protein